MAQPKRPIIRERESSKVRRFKESEIEDACCLLDINMTFHMLA